MLSGWLDVPRHHSMSFRYLSVCSGIEAASVAWKPLGWECAGLSEIDKFPRAVLQHRLGAVPVDDDHRWSPGQNFTPLFGDFTKIEEHHVGPVDLLVGGTPCQSFSIAGKRLGLDDPRGNLTLEFLALARRVRARWIVWENVPGVLSHDEGRTFGTFLGFVEECGFRWAYRVIDAQYARVGRFGRAVPQRRRRVFLVGYSGTADINPAAVLFDRESLRGNPAPRREAGEGIAPTLAARTRGGGGLGTDFDCDGGLIAAFDKQAIGEYGNGETSSTCAARDFKDATDLVAHALRGEGFDASEDGTGRGTPIVPVQRTREVAGALTANYGERPDSSDTGLGPNLVAFTAKDHGGDAVEDISPTLRAGGHTGSHANAGVPPAIALGLNLETDYGDSHASTPETDAYPLLLKLREAVGEEAFAEWGLGVSHSLQQADVLRSTVHGEGVRGQAQDGDKLGNDAPSCSEDMSEGAVQSLWSAGCAGRASPGWQPSEQLAEQLGAHLSKLSHQGAPRDPFLRDLWRAAQGLGVLRQALPAPEEARRSAGDENPAEAGLQGVRRTGSKQGSVRQALHEGQALWGVRRLTPREAARLQGFPDDWAMIPWRGKPAEECPDGPQYRAYGNSMAVNVMCWIGERIEAVRAVEGEG